MTDRDVAWDVINCDRTDGEATDTAARYVAGLERQIQAVRDEAQSWVDNADHPAARGAALAILRALDGA